MNQCASSSTLSDEQWTHLRESFARRSSYCNHTGSQDDNIEPETEDEPVFTGEELSQVDNTVLELEPEQFGNIAPVTVISPLANWPSSTFLLVMSFPAHTGPLLQSSASALFRAPDPVPPAHDTVPVGQTPNRQCLVKWQPCHYPNLKGLYLLLRSLKLPEPSLSSHLKQQNFELMKRLQRKSEGYLGTTPNRFPSIPTTTYLTVWLQLK